MPMREPVIGTAKTAIQRSPGLDERTREIGLRMAVGARARDILRQFLVEAVLLCLGIVLTAFFWNQFRQLPPYETGKQLCGVIGVLVGWLVYRKVRTAGVRLEQGEQLTAPEQFVDPLERPLGPVYRVLKNKYYFDEFYMHFVNGTVRLAKACATFDRKVVDGPVNAVGRFGRRLSNWLMSAIDNPIVDGAVNGVGRITTWRHFGQ
jgi:NADH:ubiquinone oxidoreductase subunit 5 (subunit L)/multisubunit Na+/H+ antiporter MnhA subunit